MERFAYSSPHPPLPGNADLERKKNDPDYLWEIFERGDDIFSTLGEGDLYRWHAIHVGSPHIDSRHPMGIHFQIAPRPILGRANDHAKDFPQIDHIPVDDLVVASSAMLKFLDSYPGGMLAYNTGRDMRMPSAMSWPQLHIHFEHGQEPTAPIELSELPDEFTPYIESAQYRHDDLNAALFMERFEQDPEIADNPAVTGVIDSTVLQEGWRTFKHGPTQDIGGTILTLRHDASAENLARLMQAVHGNVHDAHSEHTRTLKYWDRLQDPNDMDDSYPASPIYTTLITRSVSREYAMEVYVSSQRGGCRRGPAELLGMYPIRQPDPTISLASIRARNDLTLLQMGYPIHRPSTKVSA